MAVTFARPKNELRFELKTSKEARKQDPSLEAAECWGRGRLTFDQHTEVEAAQFRREFVFDPSKGEFVEKRYISGPKMRQALLWAWISDAKWSCNWVDESGQAITRVSQVNELLTRQDLEDLGDELLYAHYPEFYTRPEEIEVDEHGNPVESDDKEDPTTGSPTSGESSSTSSPGGKTGSRSARTGS